MRQGYDGILGSFDVSEFGVGAVGWVGLGWGGGGGGGVGREWCVCSLLVTERPRYFFFFFSGTDLFRRLEVLPH